MTRRLFPLICSVMLSLAAAPSALAQQSQVTSLGDPEEIRLELSRPAMHQGCASSVAVEIPDVLFDNDSDRLTPATARSMEAIADILRDREFWHDTFVVEGHASAPGTDAHNMALSQRRAFTVRSELLARGVADYALSMRAYGERRLLYPHDPDHPHNRRVTLRRIGSGSAIRDAMEAEARGTHDLAFRVMSVENGKTFWPDIANHVFPRDAEVFLCLSASKPGIVHVETREHPGAPYKLLGSWPVHAGGLVRVPERRVLTFAGRAGDEDIRLRHHACHDHSCREFGQGVQELITLFSPSRGAPTPQVPIATSALPACGAPGVICITIPIRHK